MASDFNLPDGMLEKVLGKFGQDRKSFDDGVARVGEWTRSQPHLPALLDSRAIGNFLLMNKCDVEGTKAKIDMYYTVRTKLDHIYKEINPKLPNMKRLADIFYLTGQPILTAEMHRACFFKLHNAALADDWHPRDFIRALVNIQEVRLREDIIYGDVFIVDCTGVTLNFVSKLTPTLLYESIHLIYRKVYNLRVKALYVVNMPSYGQTVLSVIKKLMKPKLARRVRVCEMPELKKYFPSEWLPKDFGGGGPCLKELSVDVVIVKYQDLFDQLDKVNIDEDLRPEKLNDDFLGYYGNFKKLDLD